MSTGGSESFQKVLSLPALPPAPESLTFELLKSGTMKTVPPLTATFTRTYIHILHHPHSHPHHIHIHNSHPQFTSTIHIHNSHPRQKTNSHKIKNIFSPRTRKNILKPRTSQSLTSSQHEFSLRNSIPRIVCGSLSKQRRPRARSEVQGGSRRGRKTLHLPSIV